MVAAGCQVGPDGRLTGLAASGEAASPFALSPNTDLQYERAPELFMASGIARWNGQRTARGRWVAHPGASVPRRARVVRSDTGTEIDVMLLGTDSAEGGDIITVSSEAADALSLDPNVPVSLAVFGLRPVGATTPIERRRAAQAAEGELAARIQRLPDNDLLQLAAAVMRGMGYATAFEEGPPGSRMPAVRAFPRPDAGFNLPSVRVVVRPTRLGPVGEADLAALLNWLEASGDLGLLVALGGMTNPAVSLAGRTKGLDVLDTAGLLHIWQARYAVLSAPDQAILPLQPVYFLAGE